MMKSPLPGRLQLKYRLALCFYADACYIDFILIPVKNLKSVCRFLAGKPQGMRTLSNLSFLFMLAWLFLPIAVSGAPKQQREPWFFPGDGIPVPPRQNQPWQPPDTDIPAEYVNAMSAAFQRGAADPRDCEYREVTVPSGSDSYGEFLQPLYTFPEDATVIATAEKIFNTPGTAWSEYFGKFGDARKIQQWLFAEFMQLAPYRKHVANGLKDKTAILKWQTIIIGDRVDFRSESLDGGGSGSYGDQADRVKSDPRFPGDRSTQILRVCDVYARALSALKDGGYPEFQNYWEEKERDKAIEAIASRLSRNPDYKAPVLSEMDMLQLYGF